jgi:Fe2+ transport system protein FeoA
MSPLALLNEGEMAEIVAHHSSHPHAHGFGHAHGESYERCGGDCTHCQCDNKNETRISAAPGDHLQDMGLRPGKQVEMITNSGTGPLVLRVDECRIAMGRGVAMKIYVRRIEG